VGATLIVSKKEVAINETKPSKKESLAANERDEVKLYYVKKVILCSASLKNILV